MLIIVIRNIIYCIKFIENEYHLSLIYFFSILIYNICFMFLDSKQKLIDFRENKLSSNDKNYITDEWSAVKYGSTEKIWYRFSESFYWPIQLISNIIPWIVLKLNTNNMNKCKNTQNNIMIK